MHWLPNFSLASLINWGFFKVCYTHGGKQRTDVRVYDWVQQVEALGAGELLITSMTHDGMKQGFDVSHLHAIESLVNIPIIASGYYQLRYKCIDYQTFHWLL